MKSGLDYFPLDCNMSDSVKLVEAELGLEGFALIIKLWQDIYKGEGYFKKFDKDVQLLFAREVNVNLETLSSFLYVAFERGIFDKEIFEKYEVLTSKGIQERFLKSIGRRKKVNLISEYILYDIAESENVNKINVCKNEENVCKNEKNADIFQQSKRKESKRKESKEEESISDRDFENPSTADAVPLPLGKGGNPTPTKKNADKICCEENKNEFANEVLSKRIGCEENKSFAQMRSNAKKYGEYGNVLLTDAQYESLLSELGEADLKDYIRRVDEYVQEKGRGYKDMCLTIRRWYREDAAKKPRAPAKPQKKGISAYSEPDKTSEYYKAIGDEILKDLMGS